MIDVFKQAHKQSNANVFDQEGRAQSPEDIAREKRQDSWKFLQSKLNEFRAALEAECLKEDEAMQFEGLNHSQCHAYFMVGGVRYALVADVESIGYGQVR